MQIIDLIIIYCISIFLALFFYFIILAGWFSIFISRLTKVSFQITLTHVVDLLVAYGFGLIAFIYILFPLIFSSSAASNSGSSHLYENNLVILSGIIMLYAGRLVTHQEGAFYGKLHFSGLFVISSIVFFINTFFLLKTFRPIDNVLSLSFIASFIPFIKSGILVGMEHAFITFKEIYIQFFTGIFLLATLGEGILCNIKIKPRSLLAASEKFPSDFIVVNSIYNKIDEMFKEPKSDYLSSCRCITKSCTLTAYIDKYIREHHKLVNKFNEINNKKIIPDYRVIKSPLNEKYSEIDQEKTEYSKRIQKLDQAHIDGLINKIDHNFNDFRLLILTYGGGIERMLIITTDKGPRLTRVGLYTEEPYIISLFINIFDCSWSLAENEKNLAKSGSEL